MARHARTATAALCGCTTYAKVTDPTSKSVYYTTDAGGGQRYESGAIRFRDAVTGSEVTLQASQVEMIDRAEFEAATKKKNK